MKVKDLRKIIDFVTLQKMSDFATVGLDSAKVKLNPDELVLNGYLTDVTRYSQEYYGITDTVRITPKVKALLEKYGDKEIFDGWYDELDPLLTLVHSEIKSLKADTLKAFDECRESLKLKYRKRNIIVYREKNNDDAVREGKNVSTSILIITPSEY